jgi:hypothetical protein
MCSMSIGHTRGGAVQNNLAARGALLAVEHGAVAASSHFGPVGAMVGKVVGGAEANASMAEFRLGLLMLATALTVAACHREAAQVAASAGPMYEAHCTEPLPVFTLGANSHPTKAQEAQLCSCVWENLHGWERETSEKISQGKEADISEMHMRGFMPRFGSAVAKCDGMKL